jgi:hypothetical protein
MSKSSKTGSLVCVSAADLPSPTSEELASLKLALSQPVDTSDIPEARTLGKRVKRDASGNLKKNSLGFIRQAILSALGMSQMTRYRLWERAQRHQPTLSQSAVYEYLRGERGIGVDYLEALMKAAGVKVKVKVQTRPTAKVASLKQQAKKAMHVSKAAAAVTAPKAPKSKGPDAKKPKSSLSKSGRR